VAPISRPYLVNHLGWPWAGFVCLSEVEKVRAEPVEEDRQLATASAPP
jgi:hypothetical protein